MSPPALPASNHALLQMPRNGDALVVFASLAGASLRCVVNPQWPCEALLVAAADAYLAAFPQTEVPECNVIFHRQKDEYLVAGTPISDCCANGDELDLGVTLPIHPKAQVDASQSNLSDAKRVQKEKEMSEFCVLFHKLPLGFTMKRGRNNTTEVGTIYPKSAATHFSRLAPGLTIVNIAGTQLKDMGLRQVHDVIKKAELPIQISFRGPEAVKSSIASPDFKQKTFTAVQSSTSLQERGRRKGSFDIRSVRTNNSNGSGGCKSRGRKKRGNAKRTNQQKERGKTIDTREEHGDKSEPIMSNESESEIMAETHLVRQIEQLKVQLLCKHEEAKQIARQLETCSDQLLTLRRKMGNEHQGPTITPRSRQVAPPNSNNNNTSKVRLTSEVLKAMDQKAGLPRRGSRAYASSNVSSVSGYSARSMPGARPTIGQTRSVRAATADNVSVSSYTSTSSNTSARHNRSPRGTALGNLNKRYNYMPQKYAANTTGVAEAGSTSLSSRGAVMSRARDSRNPFLTRSESPGVGYYDVQVKDRVKGGEIGDSDRSLAWS